MVVSVGIDAKPVPYICAGAVLQNTVRAGGTAGAQFCRAFENSLAQGTDHLIEFIGKFRGVESERSAAPGAFKFWCAGIKVRCQRSDAADLLVKPTAA